MASQNAIDQWVKILEFSSEHLEKLRPFALKHLKRNLLITDIYFDHPVGLRQLGWQWRLRQIVTDQDKTVEFTVKSPPSGDPTDVKRHQFKTELSLGFASAQKCFTNLGFVVQTQRQKLRNIYSVVINGEELIIQEDHYPLIPCFAEITGPKAEQDKLISYLQIPPEKISYETVSGVFKQYGIIDSTNIVFTKMTPPPVPETGVE